MEDAAIGQLGLILARMALRAAMSSDNEMVKRVTTVSADLFEGYATTGRVDEATAASVRKLGETLDAISGPISKEVWDASAAETKRVTARWNAAG